MANPFSHLADDKLMELYQSGENMAFEIIYSRYKDKVYAYVNKRLFDKNLVDDVYQSIFIKFHKSRQLYNNDYPLIKWIYTISRSELLDALKKNKVQFTELKDHQLVSDPESQQEILDLDTEKSLSSKEKEALKLRYYSEQDFSQISKILGTTEVNSRKLVSRGIKKLKTKFRGGSQ